MKKIGELLKEFLREKGWLAGNPYEPLFQEWKRIAGEALAAHARLVDVRDSILLVEVDHPGWLQMLLLRKAALLAAARRAAPQANVEGIRVKLGTGAFPAPTEPASGTRRESASGTRRDDH